MPASASLIRFERRGNATVLTACRSQLPLLLQRPLRGPRGEAVLILLTPAAALFEGDAVDLSVECAAGCDVTLSTTGATRLNRCSERPIDVALRASVQPGAVLRYLPHELLPYTGAMYRQRVEIDVASGGSVQIMDVIAPGRSGAAFSYSLLDLTTILRQDSLPVLREHFVLTPSTRELMHGFTHYGSLLTLGPHTAALESGSDGLPAMRIGASKFAERGTALKILGSSAASVRGQLLAAVPASRSLVACLPP